MLDSSLRWLARTIDAYPRRIAISCLIAAVLAAAAVTRIPVTTDLLDVMPDQAPAVVAFTDFLRDFGILGGLVIVVETGSDAPDALLSVVQTIGEQLSASPLVESVDYNLLRSGFRLVAAVPARTAEELSLEKGSPVLAAIRPADLHVVPEA